MMYETVKAFKLPWNTVSHLIGLEVSKILGRNIVCKANMDDHDYWAAQFVDERIPLSELYKLMETVNADEKARNESLPESTRTQSSAKEVGLGVAELLLSRHLGVNWTAFYLDKQHLWLLDVKEVGKYEVFFVIMVI